MMQKRSVNPFCLMIVKASGLGLFLFMAAFNNALAGSNEPDDFVKAIQQAPGAGPFCRRSCIRQRDGGGRE